MSIITRMIKLWKADIHGVMDQFEDKSLLMNQYLRDMEEALEENESQLKHKMDSRSQIKDEYEKYSNEVKKIEKDLEAAIEKDKDDIAKFLIKKLRPVKSYQEDLERHAKNLDKEIAQMREQLEDQKLQYDRVRLKAKDHFKNMKNDTWKQSQSRYSHSFESDSGYREPCEEEIEMELLRRKEAVKGGKKI
ncbi:PspA/IM30 family protein [Desulfobacterales bacterium HSG17]|nr:PspA/IM30 family protein [Desulfobacterales bacterium HSG17]